MHFTLLIKKIVLKKPIKKEAKKAVKKPIKTSAAKKKVSIKNPIKKVVKKAVKKVVKKIVAGEEKEVNITNKNLSDFLGITKFKFGELESENKVGIDTQNLRNESFSRAKGVTN